MIFRRLLGKLPQRFQWTLNNLVGIPLSEILWQIGFRRFDDWVHDITMPASEKTTI